MVFVQKSNFFHLGFFVVINSEKKIFFISSGKKRMILDQKINVLKGAKKKTFS